MPANYKKIASFTASASTSAIEFTSIPGTYTDLVLVASLRSDTSGGNAAAVVLQFNGSTTGYSFKRMYAVPGLQYWDDTSSNTPGNAAGDTTSTYSSVRYYIPNYTSSNNKVWSTRHTTENNATANYLTFQSGLWSNSAAITSVKLTDIGSPGNFVIHSSATLYGIVKS